MSIDKPFFQVTGGIIQVRLREFKNSFFDQNKKKEDHQHPKSEMSKGSQIQDSILVGSELPQNKPMQLCVKTGFQTFNESNGVQQFYYNPPETMIHYKFLHPQNDEDINNVLRSLPNESQEKITMGDQVNFIMGNPYNFKSDEKQMNPTKFLSMKALNDMNNSFNNEQHNFEKD